MSMAKRGRTFRNSSWSGTILNVTDYWLVDDQLHFTVIDENGTKPLRLLLPKNTRNMPICPPSLVD